MCKHARLGERLSERQWNRDDISNRADPWPSGLKRYVLDGAADVDAFAPESRKRSPNRLGRARPGHEP
jgi:hypothetical protein